MSDKMRESFEKWAITKLLDLRTDKDEWQRDRYYHSHVDAMWFAWQAAHAAALPPGFVAVPVEPTEEMLDAVAPFPEHLRCMHDGDAAWESAMQAATNADKMAVRQTYTAMLAARPEVK